MYKCQHLIKCATSCRQFTNNVNTVINHSIKCFVYLIYYAKCKSKSNVAALTHDCKVI